MRRPSSVRPSVCPSVSKLFAQIASSTRQMAGSPPNLHTMVQFTRATRRDVTRPSGRRRQRCKLGINVQSHRPCVSDLVICPPTGSSPRERDEHPGYAQERMHPLPYFTLNYRILALLPGRFSARICPKSRFCSRLKNGKSPKVQICCSDFP